MKHQPNQQKVYIHKTISHKKDKSVSIDTAKAFLAMKRLSSVGFMMYILLCTKKDDSSFFLSFKEFHAKTGLSKRSYIFAKKDLVKYKYFIPREDGNFDFYNAPLYLPTEKDLIMKDIINKIKAENEKNTIDGYDE